MHACGNDEEYVLAAIQNHYEVLGFSDHTPWNYKKEFTSHTRMKVSQAQGYIDSIAALREKYKDQIEIKIGFECEFFPEYLEWLLDFLIEKKIDYIKISQRLKEFRKEKKLTQEDIVQKINCQRSTFSKYENGINKITLDFLYQICKKYNISADYLLGKIDGPQELS